MHLNLVSINVKKDFFPSLWLLFSSGVSRVTIVDFGDPHIIASYQFNDVVHYATSVYTYVLYKPHRLLVLGRLLETSILC